MEAASVTPMNPPQGPDGLHPCGSEDWDWEVFRIGGQLYLYCYLRETVRIPLTVDAEH